MRLSAPAVPSRTGSPVTSVQYVIRAVSQYVRYTALLTWPIASVSAKRTSITRRWAKSPGRSRGSGGPVTATRLLAGLSFVTAIECSGRLRRPRADLSRLDDEGPDHARRLVTVGGADDPIRPRPVQPNSYLLGLARPGSRVDVGQPLDIPVVEDRVRVRESNDDEAARPDPNLCRLEANIARRYGDVGGAGVDRPVGRHRAAGEPERDNRDGDQVPAPSKVGDAPGGRVLPVAGRARVEAAKSQGVRDDGNGREGHCRGRECRIQRQPERHENAHRYM